MPTPAMRPIRQIILANQIGNWILEHRGGVTFAALIDQFPEVGDGEHLLAFSDMSNVVLWPRLSYNAREAMATLINEGKIGARMVPADLYPVERRPHLPVMAEMPQRNPTMPMWCPVAWFPNPAAFEKDEDKAA